MLQGAGGAEILEKLVENSATFAQRTKFSQVTKSPTNTLVESCLLAGVHVASYHECCVGCQQCSVVHFLAVQCCAVLCGLPAVLSSVVVVFQEKFMNQKQRKHAPVSLAWAWHS